MKKIIDVKFSELKEEFDKLANQFKDNQKTNSFEGSFENSDNQSNETGKSNYKKTKHPNRKIGFKGFLTFILLFALVIGISGSFYSVDQTEYVILTTFGVPSPNIQEPGLRFKIPFGIQEIIRVPKRTFSTTFGYKQEGQEVLSTSEKETKMITGDENIILADIEVQWRIIDPIDFTYNNAQPDVLIANAISSSLRNVIGSSTVDEALTDGRNEIIDKIKEQLVELTNKYNLGIAIVNVNLQDIDLPTSEVDAAFKSVTDAREERVTKINEANKYKNEKMNELVGKESAILSNADAQKTVLIENAKGDVAKFNALYKEYRANPQVTRKDLILNTLKQVYSNAKIMISDGETFKYLSIEEIMKGALR